VPSAALTKWQNDRLLRLGDVQAHCAAVVAAAPPNPTFVDETLRGFVLHLSAHLQGFCRDLYTECSQVCVGRFPAGLQAAAQAQFTTSLALERGNPNHANIRRDFSRFGFVFGFHAANARQITDLAHLSEWRNKAAHQGTEPLGAGVPLTLTLPLLQGWKASCDGLAASLDGIMQQQLLQMIGAAPW
jgi:hypothetical protein